MGTKSLAIKEKGKVFLTSSNEKWRDTRDSTNSLITGTTADGFSNNCPAFLQR
jgi:hypothetical protein